MIAPANPITSETLTVRELAALYATWADEYYRKPSGRPTREAVNMATAFATLVAVAGKSLVDELTPRHLRDCQQCMIARGLARSTINARTNRIRRVIRWAVAEQLVTAHVMTGLTCVMPLQRGRTKAIEPDPVRAIDDERIAAAATAAEEPIATMIRVQALTGMRSGELVIMRPADVDRSTSEGDAWIYRPTEHKSEHHGVDRKIALGPRARALLGPLLDRVSSNPWLFPGADAERWLFVHRGGTRYTPGSYRQAVQRACANAGIEPWTPLELRHTAATRLRRIVGLEAARTVLGHSRAATTEIYAERDEAAAIDAMELLG